jgi:hypothetical protein
MLTELKISRDKNGNKIVTVKVYGHRAFSIQTNGNLPYTHSHGINERTMGDIKDYVKSYGTHSQKRAIEDIP